MMPGCYPPNSAMTTNLTGMTKADRCSVWSSGDKVPLRPVRYSLSDPDDEMGLKAKIKVREFPPAIESRDIEGWCIHLDTETFAGEITDVRRSATGYHAINAHGYEP